MILQAGLSPSTSGTSFQAEQSKGDASAIIETSVSAPTIYNSRQCFGFVILRRSGRRSITPPKAPNNRVASRRSVCRRE
jgi:hypothetical protein